MGGWVNGRRISILFNKNSIQCKLTDINRQRGRYEKAHRKNAWRWTVGEEDNSMQLSSMATKQQYLLRI